MSPGAKKAKALWQELDESVKVTDSSEENEWARNIWDEVKKDVG